MIVNSSQKLSNFDSSNIKDNSSQKKRKLIMNSHVYLKKSKKIFIKRACEDGMEKIFLIVDGWDIAVDEDYVNSLNSKINDIKNQLDYQMMIVV